MSPAPPDGMAQRGTPQVTLRRLARTRSTQDVVREAARSGAAAGFCCIAAEQTAGRGRQGRSWVAPPGTALLFSVLLRVGSATTAGVPIAAGLALCDALETRCGVYARLKWPNDVVAGGGKLAGILAELEPLAPGPENAVVLGAGVNLSVAAFPGGVRGVSLHRLMAPTAPPAADVLLGFVLDALWHRLDTLEEAGLLGLLPDWRSRAIGLGEAIVAVTPRGEIRGIAVDVDDDGALLVRTAAGVERLIAGDIHLV
jgi:BirA family transcriptional regulator, biotin operon repressor / biotin---[acetyl-CoA-carboxylase] ligase